MSTLKNINLLVLFTLTLSLTLSISASANDEPDDCINIGEPLKRVVAEQFGVDPQSLTAKSKLVSDIGADRVDMMELGMALDDYFDITLNDELWNDVDQISSAIHAVCQAKKDAENPWRNFDFDTKNPQY